MIWHISDDEEDTYPQTTLCGKTRKKKSLVSVPLFCGKCVRRSIEMWNAETKAVAIKIDPVRYNYIRKE